MMNSPISPSSVIFIDSRMEIDTTQVAPGTQVVRIDPTEDGIARISQVLAAHQDLGSLQIIGHGSAGRLFLGNVELSNENLAQYESQVRGWGSALADDGDLFLFGCNVAAGDIGKTFVHQIAELTQADVAASTDLTGNDALGGDWDLEYQVGSIESQSALSLNVLQTFDGILVGVADANELVNQINLGTSQIELTGNSFILGAPIYINSGQTITIDGQGKTLNGNGHQLFVINGGTLNLVNMSVTGGIARGGDGEGGGGGGLGAGGAIYVTSGTLTTDTVTFTGNQARGGDANGTAGAGGNENTNGNNGVRGGNLNNIAVGDGGQGGNFGAKGVDAANGENGGSGGWGTGGGGGGGGGGATRTEIDNDDSGGDGGNGGSGGWGAGGGGGGGGGGDDDSATPNDEPGSGGAAGNGGIYGGNGASGSGGSGRQGGSGGQGGGGAGVGGAIFVQSGNVVLVGSNFGGNSVAGGLGNTNGQGAFADVYNIGGTVQQIDSNVGDSFGIGSLTTPKVRIEGVTQPNESGTNGSITLRLDRTLPAQAAVAYTLAGTATADTDYKLQFNGIDLNGQVVVPANTDTVTIDIVPTDDTIYDPGETIEFTLSDGQLYDLDVTIDRTIEVLDNEPVVGISAVSTITEKDGAQDVFTISLDKPAPKTLTIPYTVSGTATAGNDDDYAPLSGQVTIPEGKTTAKIAIEAFDDAIEEGSSETIVLTLNDSGGNNYQVDNNKKEARTIVSDSNTVEEPSPSDKLILIQKTGARTFVVEGSNKPDQLQILLVKQPTKDVTISFSTGDQLEPISDVTIPVADWDKPVTVDVYAKSDTIVEPKEVKVDINFTLTSDDTTFNGLEVPAREVTVRDREIDGNAFSNGLDKLLRKIDELIAQQLDSTELPLIGSLGDYTPNFIESFRESLISELQSIGMETSSTIADKIKTTIEQGLDQLGLDPDVQVNLSAGLEETIFDITIGSKSTKEADLSTDLGIPDLGLSVDGKANTDFEYKLDLGIGWHQDFGFFVDTDKTRFHADASVELNKDFNAQGNLGFLQLDAKNNPADPTKAGIKFDVSLSDLDNVPTIQYLDANNNGLWDKNEPNVAQQADGKYPTLPVVDRFDTNRNGKYDSNEGKIKTQDTPDDGERLTLSELGRDFKLGDLFSPELEGQANLGMKLVTSANGSSTLPSFLVDLNVDWDTFSYKNGRFKNLKKPTVSFDNMQVDVGSFARNFAEPIFGKIDEVVKPMRPFIDFLKQDISLFSTLGIDSLFGKKLDQNGDGKKSLAEFIGVLPNSKVNILPFIDAIDRISSINNLLDRIATTEGNFKIDLGSYTVGLPNSSGGFSLPSLDDFFSFSLPNFSIDDFSKGLTDLFDSATDIDLSWPSDLSLGDFSGGLKKLFSQSGLRSTLDLDWSNLTLEDFAEKFATSGDFNLSLGSIIGSSGTNLQNFATGLDSLLSGAPSEVAIDWSKFSLQDFALGLKAVLAGHAGRAFDLDLSGISLQEFTNRFEPLLSGGNLIPNLDDLNLRNFAQPKIAAPDIKSQTETFTTGSTKELLDSLKNGTFDFPILTNPMVAVDLLLGKPDVNLFTYDIPRLELSAGFNTSFIVFAPPTIRLGFGGNASIAADLAFGFDSKGAIEWSKQDFAPSKGYLPLDGFYLSDRANPDGTGADVKEIEAALGVYLELAAGLNIGIASLEGYARGGLQGTLGVDFRDTGESTGTADGKIRALSEIGANITQPWQLFNLQGALTATAQIGIKGSLLGFEETLYSKDFGPLTLATFEYGENGFTVATIFDGPVAGATVFFDANFNGIQDPDEPYTLSKIDGSYELAIPLELYDSDGNGSIDLSEGQIGLVDGADTDTFQDQRIPFISSPQWQVASPLTMLALKLDKPDPAQVETQVEASFGLPSGFKLYEDSPLAGITASDSNAATVFRTQAQLQNLLILGSNTLGTEGSRQPAAIALINEIVRRVQASQSIDLTNSTQLQDIINTAGATLGVIPTDFETAFDELVYLNQEIAKITGTGVVARNAIAELIPYDIADGSYLNLLENPWISLLRAAIPEPDTATAQGVVQNAFGLAGVDITRFNPIDEMANGNIKGLEVYAKQVQINATLTQLADIIVGLDVENAETVVSDALVTSLKAGESFTNMGDPAKIATLLTQVAPNLPPNLVGSLAGIIAESNAKINQIVAQANPSSDLQSLRTQIASEQSIAQGIQSQLLQSVALGEITIDQFQGLLDFNLTFNLGIAIERIIEGTEGDDTLVGDDRNEMITAFAGNDLVQTGNGDNIAYGNQGNDTLQGGTGIDILAGGRDDDLILTGNGYNYAFGNKGSDRIEGGTDIDYIYGGQDNDVVLGNAGDDWLLGDLGDDIVDGGDGYDVIVGGQGLDSLQGSGGDDIIFGNLENDTLDGGIGNDTLAAGKENDLVLGNTGDDVLFGNIGNDFLDGGEGNDTVAAGQDNDQVLGNLGDDLLYGNLGNDGLYGGDGNDTLAGGKDDDQLFGNLGNDALFGNLGNDVLDGGDGNDYLAGGQNNDNLSGSLGDDTLSGDLGDDSLTGGGGSDRFAFAVNGGNDIIADFTDGVDLIALSAELLAEIQTHQTIAVNTAEGARIELGDGSITLTGIDAGAIDQNDFVSLA